MNAANDNRPAVLDLFSGIGGFSLGLERAGFKTAAFCEIDTAARKVLTKNWPAVPIFQDVSKLTKGILNERGIEVDVICGGFPCQDISTAGRGAGLSGERSGLWREFHRLIAEIRPRFAIIENVSALRSRGLDQVLGSLAEIGYDAEWHCIPAAAVGAPHRRDRIWIVAHPKCVGQQGQGQLVPSVHPAPTAFGEADRFIYAFRERALPFVCRGHDGVSGGVDRLKQLGNAVVPQIPELIGRAIMASMIVAANDNAGQVVNAAAC